MKAILYSLMVVALVGGMVGGGLFAYFSDTETSTGNTFQAGTIEIGLTPGAVVYPGGAADAKPCETATETDVVTNSGRNELKLYKWVKIVSDSTPPLAAVTLYDLSYSIDGGTSVVLDDGTTNHVDDIAGAWMFICNLPSASSVEIVQSFHIEADAGNEYQDGLITLNKGFYAIQLGGPAPTAEPTW